jgi:hypothetical protein
MTFLHRALAALTSLQRRFPNQREAEEAYLAGAVDIYDLERRMRQLDQRDTRQPFHLRHSV